MKILKKNKDLRKFLKQREDQIIITIEKIRKVLEGKNLNLENKLNKKIIRK